MLRKIFTSLLSVIYSLSALAATEGFAVRGEVVDSTRTDELFATVRIFALPDTAVAVRTAVTADDGTFDIALKAAGGYRAVVSTIGRRDYVRNFDVTAEEPVADLGLILLDDSGVNLGEVTVWAQRPLISREIDRIGYDVEADPESKTSQLDDMLRKVPMVSVDPDGTIRIKGQTGFKIYKNGRKNNSFTNNAKDIFKSIPASMIKKIEVITDPGSREDAEGTTMILNIVTVDNMIIKGVMGNAALFYDIHNNVPSPNIWLTSQIDKVTFSLYGGMNVNSSRNGRSTSWNERTFDDSGHTSLDRTEQRHSSMSENLGFEMSYDIDSLNMITTDFWGYISSSKLRSRSSYGMYEDSSFDNPIYGYESDGLTSPSRHHWLGGTVNYQHLMRNPGEKLIVSYQISGNGSRTKSSNLYHDQFNMPVDYTGVLSDGRATFLEHTFQADWTKPLFKGNTLDVGAKYILRDNHSKSDNEYIGQNTATTDFSHLTHVGALYADYRLNIGKFGARAGVRYEYSRLEARFHDDSGDDYHSNLNDVVPNAALSYNINDRNSMRLSYSSSIQRPGINYLNPTVNRSPESTSQGNPDLSSSRYQSANFNYSFFSRKLSLDFTAGYSFSNNTIIPVQTAVDDHLYQTYENAGRNHEFSLNLFMQWQMTSSTSVMLNGGANYSRLRNPSLNLAANGWSGNGFFNLRQRLGKRFNLTAYVSYYSGSRSLTSVSGGVGASKFYHGLNLQGQFLKENRLMVRLGVHNPIGNGRNVYRHHMINVPFKSVSESVSYSQRSLVVGLSYRFGSLNAQVKKVRSIDNNDVVGGASRGQ